MSSKRLPVFVIIPGATLNPTHYGYLFHLLQLAGYPTISALLPSVGARDRVTAQDDTDYIRTRLLEPILDTEGKDVVLVTHSYSGMPGSAAAKGLGKSERAARGKSTAVLGQIFITSILPLGGDGKDVITALGGSLPPHMNADESANLLSCDDPVPPFYQDVPSDLANALAKSVTSHGMTSFKSPCPRATWDNEDFDGRIAFIRTTNDKALPYQLQNEMIEGTGRQWILRDIESGHCPQSSQPEKLRDILVELAKHFEAM